MDYLSFRFPGEDPVHQHGAFVEVASFADCEGFILTDHSGTKKYLFVQNQIPASSEAGIEPPICVTREAYVVNGEGFLSELRAKSINKAVLSRVKQVALVMDPMSAFIKLIDAYPSAFVYLLRSEKMGTWIGASPEILAKYDGNTFFTMSLAGTLAQLEGSDWTQKELDEQQSVTDFIVGVMNDYASEVEIGELKELTAGPVKHLKTEVTCTISVEKVDELIAHLHPTPAVSGFPRKEALELIKNYESHERRIYSGYLGRKSAERIDYYVNLRCGEWQGEHFYVYVGGGYNERSVVEKEWQETENKSKTLLNVLQNK